MVDSGGSIAVAQHGSKSKAESGIGKAKTPWTASLLRAKNLVTPESVNAWLYISWSLRSRRTENTCFADQSKQGSRAILALTNQTFCAQSSEKITKLEGRGNLLLLPSLFTVVL